jgi:arylsulfate sulfotransferase
MSRSCDSSGALWLAFAASTLLLAACGGGGNAGDATAIAPKSAPMAAASDVAVAGNDPGASPFISLVHLRGSSLDKVAAIDYTIEPKPGSVSKPVHVDYAIAALQRRGWAVPGFGQATLPVFGLYAGYANRVDVEVEFQDASTQSLSVDIATAGYTDPGGVYDHPTINKQRAAGSSLGFDFFVMKSQAGMPVVVDTDGEIRWMGPAGLAQGGSIAIQDNGFVIGDGVSPKIVRLELDGSVTDAALGAPNYLDFNHNLDPGKQGLLAEVDTRIAGVTYSQSTVAEITEAGTVLKEWDFAALLGAYMRSRGDDPESFVRPGTDWFHTNAATYDPRDDTVIVSSRENFVIKVDYRSGDIVWILGDPAKYWYTFPSLRAKALTLDAGGLYPIGQHATSITSDGLLMLFNDGAASFNQPPGAPAGESRTYSAVSAYAIDPATMSAREAWRFDYGRTIYSDICSSAYEAPGRSLLVDYAVADNRTRARLVGLDADHQVVFDFEYPTKTCGTSWNALPIAFESMSFS